jgi:hypothetical protein
VRILSNQRPHAGTDILDFTGNDTLYGHDLRQQSALGSL